MIFNDSLCPGILADEYEAWTKQFANRDHNGIRFGQHICNKYLCLGKSAPEIFYEENVGKAYWLIVDVLVNQES